MKSQLLLQPMSSWPGDWNLTTGQRDSGFLSLCLRHCRPPHMLASKVLCALLDIPPAQLLLSIPDMALVTCPQLLQFNMEHPLPHPR